MEICRFFGPFIDRGNRDQLSVVIWRRKVEVSRHVGECGVIGYILECLFCHGGVISKRYNVHTIFSVVKNLDS